MFPGIVIFAGITLLGIVLIGLYLAVPKPIAPPKKINSLRDMEQYFTMLTDNQTPPGLTVTVLKKGKSAYAEAFGYADWPQKKPAQVDTIYPWWSITKLFTATAIMQLYERGKLDLDTPVQEYVPYFEVKSKDGNKKTITIRQLLAHQSGLRDFIPAGLTWIRLAGKPKPNQTALFKEKFIEHYNVVKFEPGARVKYSNTGYHVLGVVIEAVISQEYETFIYENILKPLNMTETSFIRDETLQRKTATGSNPTINIFTGLIWFFGGKDSFDTYIREIVKGRMWFQPLYTDYTPSTGLSGPSRDMARFAQAFLNGGVLDGRRILQQKTVNEMFMTYNLSELAGSYNDNTYGLGWKAWKVNDQIVYGHGGVGPGFGALLAMIPERDLIIAINANDTNIKRNALVHMLASIKWE